MADPEGFFPQTVAARDGRCAVTLHEAWGASADRVSFRALVEPQRAPVILQVIYPPGGLFLRGLADALSSDPGEQTVQLARLAIGDWLDEPSNSIDVGPGKSQLVGDVTETAERILLDGRASDDDVFLYIGSKLYWSWRYDQGVTALDRIDEVRLGLPAGQLRRVALAGEDEFWIRSPKASTSTTFQPTGRLIQEFGSGTFRGLRVSPVMLVTRQLRAPRYEPACEAFEKAVAALKAGRREDAVTESVKALESMGKTALGLGKGTLDDVKKELVKRGHLTKPLDKVLDGVWGFRSSQPGAGHGGTTPPAIPGAQAAFVVNTAAAALLYLADLDR